MSLKSYCEEKNRQRILLEWDAEKNLPLTPETVAPSSGTPVWWKCERGHSWRPSGSGASMRRGNAFMGKAGRGRPGRREAPRCPTARRDDPLWYRTKNRPEKGHKEEKTI